MNIMSELATEGIDPDSNILLEIFDLQMSAEIRGEIIRELEYILMNLKRMGISPKQVFENSLRATVSIAKNAEELLLALKFTRELSETGINPEYSLLYGIPSALESISDKNILTIAFDSGITMADHGVDPWALLHYSVPALSKSNFEAELKEIQHLCFSIRCRHQDSLHRAIASILCVKGHSKVKSLRLLSETLEVLSEKGRKIAGVLESIPPLASAAAEERQLETGLEAGLAMAKKGLDSAGLLKLGFPRAIEATATKPWALDQIAKMAKRLIEKNIDPQDVLIYSIQSLMKFSKSAEDFEKGILALESLVIALSEKGINARATLFYGLRALSATCRSVDQFSLSLRFGVKLAYAGIDPCNNFKYGVAWALGEIDQTQFKAAIELAGRLETIGIDPLIALQYGVPEFAKLSRSHEEFEKGLILLEKLLIALEKHKIDLRPLIISLFSEARSYEDLKTRVEKIAKLLEFGSDPDDIHLCLKAAKHCIEFDRVMDCLMDLTAKLRVNNMDPWVIITHSIPPVLAATRSIEELSLTMKLASVLIERQIDPGYHLQHGVPAMARFTSENEYRDAIELAIKLVKNGFDPYEAMHYSIPALDVLKQKEKISAALKFGVKMADHGLSPDAVFKIALPALAEKREFEKHLETIFDFAVQLKEKKVDPSNALITVTPELAKITENAESFKNWSSKIAGLSPKLLDICLKNLIVILDYFDKHQEADWNRFAAALDIFSKGYWIDIKLDEKLLICLSSPSLSISGCVECSRDYFISRSKMRAAELGINIDRFKHEDCVGLEALLGKTAGKKTVAIEKVLEKIAEYGNCYTYFQAEQPLFYLEFKRETGKLAKAFDTPGIKFSVNYKVSAKMELKSFDDKMPITSDIKAVEEVIADIGLKHRRIYSRLYSQMRERGITVNKAYEDEFGQEHLEDIIKILLKEIQHSEIDGRPEYILALLEAWAFRETREIRKQIAAQTEPVLKLNLLAEYWGHYMKAAAREGSAVGQKFYERNLAPLLNEKADIEKYLSEKAGKTETGTFNFLLSERGISDLSKGDVSQDCLKDRLFHPGVAHLVDPAFFLFKICEGKEWIGNVYAAVCKDKENQNVLLIDNIPLKTEHPILSGRKEDVDNFAKEFLKQITSYAKKEMFDYAVIAQDCSPRIRIKSALEVAINRNPEKILLKKVAGNMHFSEFGIQTEFLQAFGKLEAKQWYEVAGYILR